MSKVVYRRTTDRRRNGTRVIRLVGIRHSILRINRPSAIAQIALVIGAAFNPPSSNLTAALTFRGACSRMDEFSQTGDDGIFYCGSTQRSTWNGADTYIRKIP